MVLMREWVFLSEDKCAGTANVLEVWWLLLRVWKSLIVESVQLFA